MENGSVLRERIIPYGKTFDYDLGFAEMNK
jgi:hypothetical protein